MPAGPKYPELKQSQTADIVIVGAGFAGLSAARRLQELNPNSRIVVLEARNIAEGPAGRNSGFMIDVPTISVQRTIWEHRTTTNGRF